MTSSPKRDDLPPGLSSIWRLCKLGYQQEPRLLLAAFLISLLAALPDSLIAVWLALLGSGVLQHNRGRVVAAAIGLSISATATWVLRTVSTRVQRRFRDKVTIALESHVAKLQASTTTIEHHERPEYLDRLAMLRNQVFVLDHMYMSVFSTCSWILRLGVTIGLLVRSILRLFFSPCSPYRQCTCRHGVRPSNGMPGKAAHRRSVWPAICSRRRLRPRQAKKSA